jgi:hypothetical protein
MDVSRRLVLLSVPLVASRLFGQSAQDAPITTLEKMQFLVRKQREGISYGGHFMRTPFYDSCVDGFDQDGHAFATRISARPSNTLPGRDEGTIFMYGDNVVFCSRLVRAGQELTGVSNGSVLDNAARYVTNGRLHESLTRDYIDSAPTPGRVLRTFGPQPGMRSHQHADELQDTFLDAIVEQYARGTVDRATIDAYSAAKDRLIAALPNKPLRR